MSKIVLKLWLLPMLAACLPLSPAQDMSGETKEKSETVKLSEEDSKLLTEEERKRAEVGIQKARRACLRLDVPMAPGGVGSAPLVKYKSMTIAITNVHVIAGTPETLDVSLPGNDVPWQEAALKIKLIKKDSDHDLAFYEVVEPRDSIPTIELFDGEVKAGMKVSTVGWPWGRGMADGYAVIDVGTVEKIDTHVWVDHIAIGMKGGGDKVNVGGGSSGGPLVDLNGRLLGIVQKVRTIEGSDKGYCLVIPLDVIKPSLDEITAKKSK